MGKGRLYFTAMKSKITPTGRWAPKPNARARCMKVELLGKVGGKREGQLARFMSASSVCKKTGK